MDENADTRFLIGLALVCGLVTLVLLWEGLFGESGMRHHQMLRRDLAELVHRWKQEELKHHQLQAEERALSQQPAYVEWIIRQELGWVRPHEMVLMLEAPSVPSRK
ncbi:MAG: septum formation initiator family protein [Myxococcales bacterium]|nr:septum formation initiator family protein [Myxococcales bacterium]